MEETSKIPMAKTTKIIRKSIYTFLQNYHYFTSTAILFALPFSASILLSQAYVPFSSAALLPAIHNRLSLLFDAAGFPPSEFFSILNLKLSQTIFSSILTLPFTLTFLLITKAAIIQALNQNKPALTPPSFSSVLTLYCPLLLTYICNSFFILAANATVFSLLFLAFNFLEGFSFSSPNFLLFLSAAGAVLYSIVLANAFIICNLALVLSGMERCGGYMAILKACVLIRGRASTALSLALPVNLALAAVEALFQYRVVRAYHFSEKFGSPSALEGILIAYLYSIFIVLDTVVNYMFCRSCKTGSWIEQEEVILKPLFCRCPLGHQFNHSLAIATILQPYSIHPLVIDAVILQPRWPYVLHPLSTIVIYSCSSCLMHSILHCAQSKSTFDLTLHGHAFLHNFTLQTQDKYV